MTADGTVLVGEAADAWRRRFETCCELSRDHGDARMRFKCPPLFKGANWRTLPIPGGVDDDGVLFSAGPEDIDQDHVELARFRGVCEASLLSHWPPVSPFSVFWPMLREWGVEEVALTGWGEPVNAVWVGPPFDEAVSKAVMRHFGEIGMTAVECALTDASGRWAIYSSPLEEVSVLGGEPTFIDAFVARAGGLAWLQAIHAIKHQEVARESFRPLYAHIGWSWPFDERGRPLLTADGDA